MDANRVFESLLGRTIALLQTDVLLVPDLSERFQVEAIMFTCTTDLNRRMLSNSHSHSGLYRHQLPPLMFHCQPYLFVVTNIVDANAGSPEPQSQRRLKHSSMARTIVGILATSQTCAVEHKVRNGLVT